MSNTQKVWVRQNFLGTAVGTSGDTTRLFGLRDASAVITANGATTLLDSEFTVIRFMGHWQVDVVDSGAGVVSNPAPVVFGGRVAGSEELEELIADPLFRAESGPLQDPMADWLFWNPAFAGNSGYVDGAVNGFIGKGMFDVRSARRVDARREDFGVMAQFTQSALTTTTQSFRLSWAALCLVH